MISARTASSFRSIDATSITPRTISSALCWQAEGEDGALPRATDDPNCSPMRLHDRFRYRQAHAGALDAVSLIFSSIEFFENAPDFLLFAFRPLVRHTEGIEFVVFICRDPDGLTRGGVELRVGDKVNQYSLRQR